METSDRKYKLLIVDDLKSIRISLQDILAEEYECLVSPSGTNALQILQEQHIDLMLTDIRMPGINGIELIQRARKLFPKLTCVLMTAYNTNEYLHYARIEKIKNIIPKASIGDLLGFRILLRKLLKQIDIFGIAHYFPSIKERHLSLSEIPAVNLIQEHSAFTLEIDSLGSYRSALQLIDFSFFRPLYTEPMNVLVLEELCSNIMQHLYFGNKLPTQDDYAMPFSPTFEISFGNYDNAIIIRVLDKKGSLNQDTILRTLEDQIQNEHRTRTHQLPQLQDWIQQGRGLHLTRELTDRLIFNIRRNVQTEVIAILLQKKKWQSDKPYSSLFIFEDSE